MNNKGSNPTSPVAQKPVNRPDTGSLGHQPNTGAQTNDDEKFPLDKEAPVTVEGAGPQKESKAEGEDFEALTENNTIPAQDKKDVQEKQPLNQEESEENNDVEERSPDNDLGSKEGLVDKRDKYPFPNK